MRYMIVFKMGKDRLKPEFIGDYWYYAFGYDRAKLDAMAAERGGRINWLMFDYRIRTFLRAQRNRILRRSR